MTQQEASIKNQNLVYISSAIALLGSCAGLMYAIKHDKSNWARLGYFILGGIIASAISGIIINSMISRNNLAVDDFKSGTENKEVSNLENNLFSLTVETNN